MRFSILEFFCLLFAFNLVISPGATAQTTNGDITLIPTPAQLKSAPGQFTWNSKTIIGTNNIQSDPVKFLLTTLSGSYQLHNKVTGSRAYATTNTTGLVIINNDDTGIPAEGYTLKVTPKKIILTGKNAGLFYGIQTLLQLLHPGANGNYTIPCLEITDHPRFAYRGLMLDVARHFFTVNEVKMVIDLMAKYKLNTFQWHLTDNEGWRIEIKKYPQLTSVGGFHANTVLESDRDELDSVSTGGYYTQEQIKDVVKYAQAKFITIVPEIEMPAHSGAALRVYPELKCVLPANSPNNAPNNIIYAPRDKAFAFLEDVLTEVVALFPGKYIHIGGDEANKKPWQESEFCQQLMKQLNIKDVHELQSYFIQRMEKFLNTKNRSIIGWDEILEGGLAQNATVMSWRGEKGGIAAAQQKHNVIMTPGPNGLYFDHYQSNSNFEPLNHEPGYHTYAVLQKTYNYDPVPASLTDDEKKYIHGVQANIWTEHIGTINKLQYMILPRIFALAEVAWTLSERKQGFNLFEADMLKQLSDFEYKGYNFRVPTAFDETDTVIIGGKFTLQHNNTIPGSTVYYTLNGHTPTENDKEYNKPLKFSIPLNQRRELQTTVITATGKRSVPTRTTMYNYAPFPAIDGLHLKPGISYQIFQSDLQDTTTKNTVLARGVIKDLTIDSLQSRFKNFRMVCEGYIKVPADVTYIFSLSAKNPNKLFIDGRAIINDNSRFSRFENPGAAPLQKGYHKIRLEYFTEWNVTEIPMYWQMAKGTRLKIQPEMLFH